MIYFTFIVQNGTSPGTARLGSIQIYENLGGGTQIKSFKEGSAEPAWSSFNWNGAFHHKAFTFTEDGWHIIKILVAGTDEVTFIRVYVSYTDYPGKALYLYSNSGGTSLTIQFQRNDPENDYEISIDNEDFDIDSSSGAFVQRAYTDAEVDNFSNIFINQGDDLYMVHATGLNADLSTDAPPAPPVWPVDEPEPEPEEGDPEVETNVTLFSPIWFSNNPITHGASAPGSWASEINPRMLNDVRIGADSVMKIALPPEADGAVTFEVSEAFSDQLPASPPAVSSEIVAITDRIKDFTHNTGFIKEDESEPESYTTSGSNRVMLGGLGKYAFKTISFFTDYLPTTRMFLTWQPNEKEVDRTQEDYLNYFNYNSYNTTLKLNIHAFFDDDTEQREEIDTIAASAGGLYQVPAGPLNCGVLAIDPAKNVVKYRLYLTNQNNKLVSEVRTYTIDTISHPNRKFIMFLNSLGAFEIHRIFGQTSRSTDFKKDVITKFLPLNYTALSGERESNFTAFNDKFNYSTGFISSAQWLDYFKDLLRSYRVFDTTDGKRRPIIIEGGSYDMDTDQVYERYIRFTASDSFEDENYTPRV